MNAHDIPLAVRIASGWYQPRCHMIDSDPRRRHFDALTPEEQVAAIRSMAQVGSSLWVIAAATGLSVEAVRLIVRDDPEGRA